VVGIEFHWVVDTRNLTRFR